MRTQWALGLGVLVGLVIVIGSLSACSEPVERGGPAHPTTAVRPPAAIPTARPSQTVRSRQIVGARPRTLRASGRSALVTLAALPVKGRAPKTGYGRGRFGAGWATVAGCDMRDRILGRDLTRKRYTPGDRCEVRSGRLNDPYTGALVVFVRGGDSEVDIDHVVALADAWQKGAQQWSVGRRVAFANDPLNLLAVDAHVNRAKGDGDAATWLPPNKRFRCAYVARQLVVKRKYGAWVTRAEHDAIARVLATCPGQNLPRADALQVPVVARHEPPTPSPSPKPSADDGSASGRVFANCSAVRGAGLAPLRRGSANYAANPGLDRDKDGLACEG